MWPGATSTDAWAKAIRVHRSPFIRQVSSVCAVAIPSPPSFLHHSWRGSWPPPTAACLRLLHGGTARLPSFQASSCTSTRHGSRSRCSRALLVLSTDRFTPCQYCISPATRPFGARAYATACPREASRLLPLVERPETDTIVACPHQFPCIFL